MGKITRSREGREEQLGGKKYFYLSIRRDKSLPLAQNTPGTIYENTL